MTLIINQVPILVLPFVVIVEKNIADGDNSVIPGLETKGNSRIKEVFDIGIKVNIHRNVVYVIDTVAFRS